MSDTPRSLPSDTNKLLDKNGIEGYQSKIGSLLYLANQSRPDILYAVNMHSRYTKSPTQNEPVEEIMIPIRDRRVAGPDRSSKPKMNRTRVKTTTRTST